MTPIPTPQNSKYIYTKQDEEIHAQGGHTHTQSHMHRTSNDKNPVHTNIRSITIS